MKVCPQLQSTGVCIVHICEPCGMVLIGDIAYRSHLTGQKHPKRIERMAGRANAEAQILYECPVCKCPVPSSVWPQHIKGKRHISAARSSGVPAEVNESDLQIQPGFKLCELCNITVLESAWPSHLAGRSHTRSERFVAYKAGHAEATKDKHGVMVSSPDGVDFDIVEVAAATSGVVKELEVVLTAPTAKINIVSSKWSSSSSALRRNSGSP
jgi:helicase MOV-10